ncbi:hypothetical protein SoKa_gp5 [Pseudomonas phage SoKa]|uniref:Uncharacterized protein n=1 Tax=Pseudomonas phage SoKa TaxID=2930393 RepID=A0AAE9GPX4_9CAUD|nr:hypothetical protein SoKa_gp5 [Pseudomonas phage SoKa]
MSEKPAILTRTLGGTITGTTRFKGAPQNLPKHKFPNGSLVRASKAACRAEYASGIPFGMVSAITADTFRSHSSLEPWYRITGSIHLPAYILPESALKPAKQAEKKRAAYSQRRG